MHKHKLRFKKNIAIFSISIGLFAWPFQGFSKDISILNASYDPTRELFRAYNHLFAEYWKAKTGDNLTVYESHGGSGKQARAVIDGMPADVVTLALAGDIDALNRYKPLIDKNWQNRLPAHSTPYTSTIVFLVRKGNPKHIHDWDDLIKSDIQVVTPNPKTSGGARWNFLAAWAYAQNKYGSEDKAYQFVKALYARVPIMDTSARGSTLSFVQRGLGDVLISWENEAYMAKKEEKNNSFEIITPSISILTEPSVAVVDSIVDHRGSREVATAYLQYLYSDPAQRLIAQNYYRPCNPAIAMEFRDKFPSLTLMTIDKTFGGWKRVKDKFFSDNGIFDKIIREIRY